MHLGSILSQLACIQKEREKKAYSLLDLDPSQNVEHIFVNRFKYGQGLANWKGDLERVIMSAEGQRAATLIVPFCSPRICFQRIEASASVSQMLSLV